MELHAHIGTSYCIHTHTSSIKGRMFSEDLANIVIEGRTVVLKSILQEDSVNLWTAFHWRKVHC